MFAIEVNGETREASAELSLQEWLAQWELDRCVPFVVALNDTHVPKTMLNEVVLEPGDRIEVLTVSQGG